MTKEIRSRGWYVWRGALAGAGIALVSLVACTAGAPESDAAPAVDEPLVTAEVAGSDISPVLAPRSRMTASGYHDLWRKLWEDHITWTRVVIISVLDDLPGNDAYVGRLLQNYEDMEDALRPFYGAKDVEAFGGLIKEHLVIAADILAAAKAGDQAKMDTGIVLWRANAEALAKQMSDMNPKYWPRDAVSEMLKDHLDFTLKEAEAHASGDYDAEIAAWEEIHGGALMMADQISLGVIDQARRPTPSGPRH